MIKAIALDDEPPALQIIASFCNRIDFIELEKTFYKTTDAAKYLDQFPVDLIFLDINMPSISGIEFYKKIPRELMVIFTTAYSEFAVEGFNLNAVDYLLKPFTFERFLQAAERAKKYSSLLNTSPSADDEIEFIFLRADYSLIKLAVADIIFIESLDDYLKIHLRQQKPLVVRLTMKGILEKLPPDKFIRIHRSYIISFSQVQSIRNRMVTIAGTELPVGSSYQATLSARFSK